jgi:hypothetical protein
MKPVLNVFSAVILLDFGGVEDNLLTYLKVMLFSFFFLSQWRNSP